MKPFILLVILGSSILLFSGCNTNRKKLSSSCKDYIASLKESWTFDDASLTYKVKGDAKDYWSDSKYINEPCLIGMSKKQIIKIFGQPSKVFEFINYHHFYYCMEEACLLTVKSTGKQIGFFFDEGNKVAGVFVNPPILKPNNNGH